MKLEDFKWVNGRASDVIARFFNGQGSFEAADVRDMLDELRCERVRADSMYEELQATRRASDASKAYEVATIAHVLATLSDEHRTTGSALEWGSALQQWIQSFVRRTLGLSYAVRKSLGLYPKYLVERLDGSSRPGGKHERCDYFVLDWDHDPIARRVMDLYAKLCVHKRPELADDINLRLAKLGYHLCIGARRKPGEERPSECSEPAVIPLGNGVWFCVEHAKDYDLSSEGSDALERWRVRGKNASR